MKKTIFLALFAFSLISLPMQSQVYSNKEAGKNRQSIADSLKTAEYPYHLPIWGDKVTKAGFSLPYSAGFGVNYLWQESGIVINNLKAGFNGGRLYNLDEIVHFNNATARSNIVNIRPDLWILPFLNVYGIFAKSETSTEIDIKLQVPTQDGYKTLTELQTTARFSGTSVGFGLTPTMGIGGGWMALDMNFTWTDFDALDEPAFTFVFGPRLGKTFHLKKPERNIAVWVGGFRVKLNSSTNGSLPLNELFSSEDAYQKVDEANNNLNEAVIEVENWWQGLGTIEQNLPKNKAKYATANLAFDLAGVLIGGAENAVTKFDESTVEYSLDKKQKSTWNFIVGSQFQLNKHWMLRGEFGFLTSRTQMLVGLQYRFGL